MLVDSGLEYRDSFSDFHDVHSRPVTMGNRSGVPLVTIAIPSFRRPQLLREAVASALAQTAAISYEVIVVDNDPDETASQQTRQLIASFQSERLHYFQNAENIGMFGNWNRCLELARGEWVTILNDDDWLAPDFLVETMAVVTHNPAVDLLAVRFDVRDQRAAQRPVRWSPVGIARRFKRCISKLGRWLTRWPRLRRLGIIDYYFTNPHAGSLGVLFRRSLGVSLGGFRQELYPTADNWFFVRFAIAHRSWMLNRELAFYRIRENESVKPEVLSGFVEHGSILRRQLNHRYFGDSLLLSLYARMFDAYQRRGLKRYWSGGRRTSTAEFAGALSSMVLRLGLWLLGTSARCALARSGTLAGRHRRDAGGPDA